MNDIVIDGISIWDKPLHIKLKPLTVFVGPQGSGKSIASMTIYLLEQLTFVKNQYKHIWGKLIDDSLIPKMLTNFFGTSIVEQPDDLLKHAKQNGKKEQILYIPAHRNMLLLYGWYPPAQAIPDYPFVVRRFTDIMLKRLGNMPVDENIFLTKHWSKKSRISYTTFNKVLASIYTSTGTPMFIKLVQTPSGPKIVGEIENNFVPVSAWSTGQREAFSLLFGLLLGTGKYQYIFIEEPELGLHTKAQVYIFSLLLEAIAKGKHILFSTHSQVFLQMLWAIASVKKEGLHRLFTEFFGLKKHTVTKFVQNWQGISVYMFKDRIIKDISHLDTLKEDFSHEQWGGEGDWGGLLLDDKLFEIVNSYSKYK